MEVLRQQVAQISLLLRETTGSVIMILILHHRKRYSVSCKLRINFSMSVIFTKHFV